MSIVNSKRPIWICNSDIIIDLLIYNKEKFSNESYVLLLIFNYLPQFI